MGISAAILEQHWSMSGAVKIACLFHHHCNCCLAALSLTIASPETCAWRVATEVCLQELIAKVFSIFWGVSRRPELLAEKQSQVFKQAAAGGENRRNSIMEVGQSNWLQVIFASRRMSSSWDDIPGEDSAAKQHMLKDGYTKPNQTWARCSRSQLEICLWFNITQSWSGGTNRAWQVLYQWGLNSSVVQ